jgi:hypothetical protein
MFMWLCRSTLALALLMSSGPAAANWFGRAAEVRQQKSAGCTSSGCHLR